MSNSSQNNLQSEHTCVEQLEQKEEDSQNEKNGLSREQIHFGDNFENDEVNAFASLSKGL